MINLKEVETYSINSRKSKFSIQANLSLKNLAQEIKIAREKNKQFILMMGAHLIKLGLSEFIIDLLKKGFITHLAVNGAGMIHDFEVSYAGTTSEYVEDAIKDGKFGFSYETGHYLNKAAKIAAKKGIGLGKEVGNLISEKGRYKEFSIFYNALKKNIPITVHTSIGAEIIYQHPECNAAALGKSSYDDFKILINSISKLEQGVVVNLGSAVILPEVFLKALSIARNLNRNNQYLPQNFTTANLDMINHYRPRMNVVERTSSAKKFIIIEKHEKSIPMLHYFLTR